MQKFKTAAAMVAIAFLLSACIGATANVKSYSDMTPQEKVGVAKRAYNNAADEYRWQYNARKNSDGKFSEDDTKFLQNYLEVMQKSHRAVVLYEAVVITMVSNEVTSVEAENAMIMAIRDLTTLLGGN